MNYLQSPNSIILAVSVEELSQMIRHSVSSAFEERLPKRHDDQQGIDGEDLLTRKEVAELLHVSFTTLRKYEKTGDLLPRRIGRRVLYRKEDVHAALQRPSFGRGKK